MNVSAQRIGAAQDTEAEKRASRVWKSASGGVDVDFVGKNEESAPGHAFGYETARRRDKTFQRQSVELARRFGVRLLSTLRLFAQLDDLEPDQVLPGFHPELEERAILRFH